MSTEANNLKTGSSTVAAEQAALSMAEFKPYIAAMGDTYKAEAGYRLVKCQYKVPTSGKNKGHAAAENSYIAIPNHITVDAVTKRVSDLAPIVVAYLQEHENVMIKKDHVAGTRRLSDSSFTLDKVIADLEASGIGRLNKEQIDNWFDSVADKFAVAFAEQLGYSTEPSEQELENLIAISDVFKSKFGALSSPKTSYIPTEAVKLGKYITSAGTEVAASGVGSRLLARLSGMKEQKESDLLAAL